MANLPGELAQQIHLMQQEGAHSMRLRLVPENLGDIQIEIQGTGDRLQVRLISSNPAVRDALENQMSNLKDALQKQGLALDNATVDGGAAGRNAPRESERRPASTTYRAAATISEPVGARIQTSAPLALGSSALNILA
jgi:flagellar hook-length control protein FliK